MKVLLIIGSFLFLTSLKSHAQEDIKITDAQTIAVFNFLFGSGQASNLTVSDQDKEHAIFFIKELIKGSCKMSIIESISDINGTLLNLMKNVAEAVNGCDQAKKGKYYESVGTTLANNFSQAFEIRKQTGEW